MFGVYRVKGGNRNGKNASIPDPISVGYLTS